MPDDERRTPNGPISMEEWLAKRRELRAELLAARWVDRDLPERDYLLGNVVSTTSRILIWGDTGIGKTLLAMFMAGAMAAGLGLLNWGGRRPCRIMYLDGELPAETFKERMQMIVEAFGPEIEVYGYCRDVLALDDMPPLNSDQGLQWLRGEIAAIRPDVIIFDSIMCLLTGPLTEEEPWLIMKPFVRWLSSKRIAQIWLNHTTHEGGHSFGTKTREWEMDTVIGLTKVEDDDTAMQIEFKKARLRTPQTAEQFATRIIRLVDGQWTASGLVVPSAQTKSDASIMRRAVLDAHDAIADGIGPTHGLDGKSMVRKVLVEDLRNEVKSRGYLDCETSGQITVTARKQFSRAMQALLAERKLVQRNRLVWKP